MKPTDYTYDYWRLVGPAVFVIGTILSMLYWTKLGELGRAVVKRSKSAVAAGGLSIRLALYYRDMPTGSLDTLIGELLAEPLRIDPSDLYQNMRVEMLSFYWTHHKQDCTLDQVVRRAETIYSRYLLGTNYSLAKQYWIRAKIEMALIDSINRPFDLLIQHDQLLFTRVLKAAKQ